MQVKPHPINGNATDKRFLLVEKKQLQHKVYEKSCFIPHADLQYRAAASLRFQEEI